MTKQSKVKLSVISAMLLLAVGLPVASIVGNAPSHAHGTASLEQPAGLTIYATGTDDAVTETVTLPAVTITAPAPRAAKPAAKAQGSVRCVRRQLESVSDGFVTACSTEI